MKRMLFTALLMTGIMLAAHAQTSGSNSSKNTSATSASGHAKKHNNSKKKSGSATDSLNNRVNYQWKNGQESTPTGHAATSTNGGGYASLKKDTAQPKKKQK